MTFFSWVKSPCGTFHEVSQRFTSASSVSFPSLTRPSAPAEDTSVEISPAWNRVEVFAGRGAAASAKP